MDSAVQSWRGALADFTALTASLADEDWRRESRCPGWSVADVVAHVIDLEGHFLGDPRASGQPAWEALPHVTTEMQRFIEVGVDARRGQPPTELLRELREVSDRREAQLQRADLTESVPWFVGEIPLAQLLWLRTFDIWTHEQDIRTAADRPGGLDSPAAAVVCERIRERLPAIWGKKVGAAATLQLVIAPPGPTGNWLLTVREGRAVYVDVAEPEVRIDIGWADLAARGAGRIPAAEVPVTIAGDVSLGRRLLAELPFTP